MLVVGYVDSIVVIVGVGEVGMGGVESGVMSSGVFGYVITGSVVDGEWLERLGSGEREGDDVSRVCKIGEGTG
ncbi:hypothetical protein Tco_1043138 [Tanacetum coccineum]|uniref:Uncharacterized protein n=1 Tax=Tanacetum coccineum TaxID=301880 RepID=A0ABQ5GLJ9_9ASTR